MRAAILLALTMSLGCLQLTGVADYKVEETPAAPVCTPPPGSPCRVGPNCGCPDGQSCMLAGVDGSGLCEAHGALERGATCTANGECGKGMACYVGFCQPFCGTDKDCDTNQCEGIAVGDPPQAVQNVGVCLQPCDPANDTCASGTTCQQTSTSRFSCLLPP